MFEQEGGKFRKFENLKQQKSILGETKSIFNSFKGVFGKVIADTSYKKTMIERNRIIFFLLFGCPMARFGLLSSRQSHSSNVNHYIYSSFDPKVIGNLITRLGH